MRALIHDPAAPQGLTLGEVPDPVPAPGQSLVAVEAIALNFGELAYLSQSRQAGEVPGWDAAGIVIEAAADGSGPPQGTRVVTFGWSGAWAQQRAGDTRGPGPLPRRGRPGRGQRAAGGRGHRAAGAAAARAGGRPPGPGHRGVRRG